VDTPYGRLMWASTLRRAAALEAWLVLHNTHYPGPHVDMTIQDPFTQTARCSCGALATFTIIVSMDVKVKPK